MYRRKQNRIDVRLLHEGGSADLPRPLYVARLVRAREDDNTYRRVRFANPPGRFDSVQHRHADVHHDDVGRKRLRQCHTLPAVSRATHDLDPVVRCHKRRDELREEVFILDDQQAKDVATRICSRSHAETTQLMLTQVRRVMLRRPTRSRETADLNI